MLYHTQIPRIENISASLDAVYFGGEMFSLRAGAGNLTIEEMKEGIAFAHERGKRCYLTINILLSAEYCRKQ